MSAEFEALLKRFRNSRANMLRVRAKRAVDSGRQGEREQATDLVAVLLCPATHTPGPWTALPAKTQPDTIIIRSDGEQSRAIAYVNGTPDQPGDAALIAAAPDLLAALRELVEHDAAAHSGFWKSADRHARAVAAIAKAEGRPV